MIMYQTIPNTNIKYDDTRKILTLDEMNDLCNKTDNFDYIDEIVDGITTRTFNYRLNIYKNFMQTGARNFRGTVYNLNNGELLALPYYKFFNYNECLFTHQSIVNDWDVDSIYDKVDGSLIYFYKINNNIIARTQRSCTNEHSYIAMNIINNNPSLMELIESSINNNYTPLFELITYNFDPHIVKYNNKENLLCLLGFRNMKTGIIKHITLDFLSKLKINNIENILTILPNEKYTSLTSLINDMTYYYNERKNVIEGYVINFKNNEMIKVKSAQYFELSKIHDDKAICKNDISIVKYLFDGNIDDILSEFIDDEVRLSYINNIIKCVDDTFNKKLKEIYYNFYEINNQLSRKDYVIKAKKEFPNTFDFGIAIAYFEDKKLLSKKNMDKIKNAFISKREWRKSQFFNN